MNCSRSTSLNTLPKVLSFLSGRVHFLENSKILNLLSGYWLVSPSLMLLSMFPGKSMLFWLSRGFSVAMQKQWQLLDWTVRTVSQTYWSTLRSPKTCDWCSSWDIRPVTRLPWRSHVTWREYPWCCFGDALIAVTTDQPASVRASAAHPSGRPVLPRAADFPSIADWRYLAAIQAIWVEWVRHRCGVMQYCRGIPLSGHLECKKVL